MSDLKIISFIDRGNIVRSQLAAILTQREIEKHKLEKLYVAESFRTQGYAPDDPEPNRYPNLTYYPKQWEMSKDWLRVNGIDLSKRWSTALVPWYAEKSVILFAMDVRTKTSIHLMFPEYSNKIRLFSEISNNSASIPDPEFTDEKDQTIKIYQDISDTVTVGFDRILILADESREFRHSGSPETWELSKHNRKEF